MGKSRNAKPLTHEEIWDDSALVRSWDEAVEEYKLYHSIHAKGENVEDVLRDAEGAEEEPGQNGYMDAEIEGPASNQAGAGTEQNAGAPQQPEADTQMSGIGPGAGTVPQAALGQVQDEGLKNLMMSWYFAGYYTGLYEGEQRAIQNKGS